MPFVHLETPKLPELKRENDPRGRRWYKVPNGEKYASVTTMLGHKEKQPIIDWRNSLGHEKADKETKRCADRGTNIHEMIEKYLKNEPYPEFTKGYKQEYINGFNQLKFRLNKIQNIRAQEVGLYSDTLRLAGTVDCVGDYEGKFCIIDFKTSNNNKDLQMIEDYMLQTTAYAIMWSELTGQAIEDVVILMTVEKGMVPLMFKDTIDKYVLPLLQRRDEFYAGVTK